MPASKEACRKALLNFKDSPGFPKSDDTDRMRQLLDAFQRWAVTDLHADRMSDHLLHMKKFCPSPSEIREASLAVGTGQRAANTGCRECGGTGWRPGKEPTAGGPFAKKYEGVAPCRCRSVAPNWEALDDVKSRSAGDMEKP